MARRGPQVEAVEGSKVGDPPKRRPAEGALALERVEHDAFEEVAEGHLVMRGESLQNPEDPPLDPDAGLNALNDGPGVTCRARIHGTNVPRYQRVSQQSSFIIYVDSYINSYIIAAMSLEFILLGLLRRPASGYDLKKFFDEGIGYFWAAELSQIYPTLKRLEKRGWVRGRAAASKRGSGRRVYVISPTGRRALREWLRGGPQFGDERFAYLAQVYFMDELKDLRQTIRFFGRMRDQFASKLEVLRAIDRRWAEADPRYPDDLPAAELHIQLTLRKGLLSLDAHVTWCDEAIRRLSARITATKPRRLQPKRTP